MGFLEDLEMRARGVGGHVAFAEGDDPRGAHRWLVEFEGDAAPAGENTRATST